MGLSQYFSLRFVLQVLSIYAAFLCWGYLQEKITSQEYLLAAQKGSGSVEKKDKFVYTFTLNLFMAIAGTLTAGVLDYFTAAATRPPVSILRFWKAAITCAAASPIGYASLQYIPYPLMVLTKTMKPVPVLLVGVLIYHNVYPWYQYVTVLCLSGGLALYTFSSPSKGGQSGSNSSGSSGGSSGDDMVTLALGIPGIFSLTLVLLKVLWGIVLVAINLVLDGVTNNEQDDIFGKDKISGLQMMKYTNAWQIFFIVVYLLCGWAYSRDESELSQSISFLERSPEIQRDISLFCLCAGIGQVLVFQIMQEHGSLVWITVSITRKLATILVSVVVFQHALNAYQYVGIILVFGGITLYTIKKQQDAEEKKQQKKVKAKSS